MASWGYAAKLHDDLAGERMATVNVPRKLVKLRPAKGTLLTLLVYVLVYVAVMVVLRAFFPRLWVGKGRRHSSPLATWPLWRSSSLSASTRVSNCALPCVGGGAKRSSYAVGVQKSDSPSERGRRRIRTCSS
jgi:hypothetical protein